jgi:hypothetical protein
LETHDKLKEANLLANITLIDGYSNKHRIGKKAPSDYIAKFAKDNKDLAKTLETHLIKNIETYGVRTNDYDTFIRRRTKSITAALNAKLMAPPKTVAADAE